MSNGPVDYINDIASKLTHIVANLSPEIRLKLAQGGNHAIQWDTETDKPFATFGLRPDGIDWLFVDNELRTEFDDWLSTRNKGEKDELEREFFEQLSKILDELGLGYDKNVSNVLLFMDVPNLVKDNIFIITTNQTFNWLDIDMDVLTETIYKIAAVHVIGWSFFENNFGEEQDDD